MKEKFNSQVTCNKKRSTNAKEISTFQVLGNKKKINKYKQ